MSDIISSLRRQDFPRVARSALQQVAKSFAQGKEGSIPGIGSSDDDLSDQLTAEFIFQETKTKSGHSKKLTAIQELQLLEILLQFFRDSSTNDVQRQHVFKTLFSGNLNTRRRDVLYKLVSMAISVKCTALLDCAAVWMQRQGCSTDVVVQLAEAIVQDYCMLVPGASATLQELPSLSLHFTCNLVTAITAIYQPPGLMRPQKLSLPNTLLDTITGWIETDSQLCLISLNHSNHVQAERSSLWTSPTKSNTQTPIPGLVRWVTQAPLHIKLDSNKCNGFSGFTNSGNNNKSPCTSQAWSRLHLAVLKTFLVFQTLPGANQLDLFTLTDMHRIVRELGTMLREVTGSDDLAQIALYARKDETIHIAIDRMVQILQVALGTGGFRCSLGDLQNICNSIPENNLLHILQNQHFSRTPPPMHHESR